MDTLIWLVIGIIMWIIRPLVKGVWIGFWHMIRPILTKRLDKSDKD